MCYIIVIIWFLWSYRYVILRHWRTVHRVPPYTINGIVYLSRYRQDYITTRDLILRIPVIIALFT